MPADHCNIQHPDYRGVDNQSYRGRANWKGFLRLSLVSCPVALYPATSDEKKIGFNRINKKTGNRLRQQSIDEITKEMIPLEAAGKANTASRSRMKKAIELESKRSIHIEQFVPAKQIDQRYMKRLSVPVSISSRFVLLMPRISSVLEWWFEPAGNGEGRRSNWLGVAVMIVIYAVSSRPSPRTPACIHRLTLSRDQCSHGSTRCGPWRPACLQAQQPFSITVADLRARFLADWRGLDKIRGNLRVLIGIVDREHHAVFP